MLLDYPLNDVTVIFDSEPLNSEKTCYDKIFFLRLTVGGQTTPGSMGISFTPNIENTRPKYPLPHIDGVVCVQKANNITDYKEIEICVKGEHEQGK